MQWSAELGRKYELQRHGTGGYKCMLRGNKKWARELQLF
jgi:hypothetical protein